MKILFYTLIIVFNITFFSCFDEDTNSSKIKIQSQNVNIRMDNNELRKLLENIAANQKTPAEHYDKLLLSFERYEKNETSDFFSKENDDKLFYNKINILKNKSNQDINALKFLINLSLLIKKNIEVSEFLMELIPELAIQSTTDFVYIYSKLNLNDKHLVIESLEYFKGPLEYKKFNANLDKIDSNLKEVAQDLKLELKKYLYEN